MAGDSLRGRSAPENVRRQRDELLPGRHHVEVVGRRANHECAVRDEIVAHPTLIGDLSNRARRLRGLALTD